MKLSYKLFISYVFVIAVALLVLAIATAFVAPANFSSQMTHMRGNMSGMMAQRMVDLDEILQNSFQDAINQALISAGIAAILASLVVSWLISQRIISPIRSLVTLSQRIARGDYKQRLNLNTGDELAELVKSFNRMTEALANTEARRVQLLGDVTHELKTPLASIKGYMEGLQDGVLPATPETYQLIHREADRLERLVRDLQELSRAEAGELSMHITPQQLSAIITPVIEHMRPQFNDKDITLHINIADHLPAVNADTDRTAQIITNLLGNALQYSNQGGDVHINARQQNNAVEVSIRDSGIGIAPDDIDLIFQRFYRVDKSRSRASGGSGIGLTIAKHLVEAQQGEIQVSSEGIGKGTTFTFTLPTV